MTQMRRIEEFRNVFAFLNDHGYHVAGAGGKGVRAGTRDEEILSVLYAQRTRDQDGMSDHEREITDDEQEALVMEKRGDVCLSSGRVIEARRLFRIADALREPHKVGHDD